MLFLIAWKYPPENRDKVIERFKQTRGQPPEGVKLIGRWHSIQGGMGLGISETDNPEQLYKWLVGWTDLIQFDATPVLDDAGIMSVLPG